MNAHLYDIEVTKRALALRNEPVYRNLTIMLLTLMGLIRIFHLFNILPMDTAVSANNIKLYLSVIIIMCLLAIGLIVINRLIFIIPAVFAAILEIVMGIYLLLNIFLLGTINIATESAYSIFIGALLIVASDKLCKNLQTLAFSKRRIILEESKSEYAVELIDVKKDYILGPVVIKALRGIAMRVKRGEFVAIMGPSGSGKTTLLNIIGALDRPTSGKVLIDGIDISQLNDDELAYLRNQKIGFIFQAYNLINRTSVLRNVELPAIVAGVPKKERIKRAKEVLKIVGLEKEMHRQPKYLSGGQQQRVAIARALINNPSIILADEPTGNLDSKTGMEIMNYLRKLNREFGTTIIVVTHDREVATIADRIFHIRDGVIVKEELVKRNGD